MTTRIQKTERPYLTDVCEKYADVPNLTMMCVGSVHWNPPKEAMEAMVANLGASHVNKYGDILGEEALRSHLKKHLHRIGINTDSLDVAVTAGANQAFNNIALALCDPGDKAVLIAPFYCSHKQGLQLSGAEVNICPFNPSTFAPDFQALESMISSLKPKVVVLTSPNNPSGYVYTRPEVQRVVQLCKAQNSWLVADQTYHEFLYDDAQHVFPCGKHDDFAYDKIIHVFSFSKIFGMAGWRVGFLAYPRVLTDAMQKIQDTVPTHAARLSQDLALKCMELYYPLTPDKPALSNTDKSPRLASAHYSEWAKTTVGALIPAREALWPIVAPLGTIYTKGAFYFLVPVPAKIAEDEAVDILARQFGVLPMPGTPFGVPKHIRLSFANLPPNEVANAVDKVKRGLEYLQKLSKERE